MDLIAQSSQAAVFPTSREEGCQFLCGSAYCFNGPVTAVMVTQDESGLTILELCEEHATLFADVIVKHG
jgi:hypothetical protein